MKAIVITLIQYVVYENRAVERAKQPDSQPGSVGRDYLKGLSKLKDLALNRSRVTPDGILELQKSLPNCKITGP